MKIRIRAAVAAIVLGAWLAVPAAQAKQPSPAELGEAQRRFQRATELFEENNLPGALAEFRRAHSLAPNYRVLYNIGQLCYLMQDNPCAYGAFSSYLAQGAGEIPEPRRLEVQRDLSRLQARVARLRIIADRPGAEVTVDDVSVGTTPLLEPVLVAAGRPRVRVSLEGYPPATQVVEVAAMETARVEIHLGPPTQSSGREAPSGTSPPRRPTDPVASLPTAPVEPPGSGSGSDPDVSASDATEVTQAPDEPSSTGTLTTVGITLGAVGLASLAGGGFASFRVHTLEREIEKGKLGQFEPSKLTSQQNRARRYQSWQWIGYGAGGATLVAAIVLVLMDGGDTTSREAASSGLSLSGALGPGGSPQVGLTGRF